LRGCRRNPIAGRQSGSWEKSTFGLDRRVQEIPQSLDDCEASMQILVADPWRNIGIARIDRSTGMRARANKERKLATSPGYNNYQFHVRIP
jgi:hypothetical protein